MDNTAILLYDHYLTLPVEINCVWARRKGVVSWLFIVNRYLALFGNIAALFINLIDLPSEIFFQHQNSVAVTSVAGCNIAHTFQNGIRLAVPWECVFFLDAIVLGLTIFKTRLATQKSAIGLANNAVHIPTLIIRDALLSRPEAQTHALSASSIGVTLISRVVLNLREVAEASRESHDLESMPKWAGGTRSLPRSSYSVNIGSPAIISGKVMSEPGWDMHMKVIDISPMRRYPDWETQEF
ncbi:hypothetical protein HWV62_8345 [Athelia sp. TMB]|nr:hypothetical protein HWV62_8345 [Athelia sp. TMB]